MTRLEKLSCQKQCCSRCSSGKRHWMKSKGKRKQLIELKLTGKGNEKLKSKNLVAEFQSCEKSVVGSFRLSTSIPDESNYIRSPLAFGERGNAVANL